MDTSNEIFSYLPYDYKNSTDLDYFNFLIHSVKQNYEAENYHFAMVALHMIYMGIIYHYIYAIFRADKERFKLILIGKHDFLWNNGIRDFNNLSWNDLSLISEKEIFQFYRSVGIENADIKILKKPVGDRNGMLHTNGTFISDLVSFENKEIEYLNNLEKITSFCLDEYKKLYFDFLLEIKDIGFDITDKDEALEYLKQKFIKEFGVNENILKGLAGIGKAEYPKDTEIFFDTLNELVR